MEKKFEIPSIVRTLSLALVVVGVVVYAAGFVTNPERTWANFLLNNIYFLGLAVGGAFFLAIQYITQSGWSAQFKRIPEAMSMYFPVAAIMFLPIILFGTHSIYHWSHTEHIQHDALMVHKSAYLNLPFFALRYVIYFALWIFFTQLLRRWSIKEDAEGGLEYFKKSEFYSRVLIFIFAFSFSLFAVDWIMAIDAHWFSTIFAAKNFLSAFQHAVAIITLILIYLKRQGYFPAVTNLHLHDLSRYIFILTIAYGYFWFSQFFLIWFANIPEETVYYVQRMESFKALTLSAFALNFAFPFLFLLWNKIAKSETGLIFAAFVMIIGHWLDLYEEIIPGIAKLNPEIQISGFAWIEIGGFLGFAGLFIFVLARALSRANVIAIKHPYLEESLQHDAQ
ncbi:MAG: hypothetical protein RIS47_1800 [Bacteroidota bacterium]|jgi:hypothetical protein